MKRVLMLSWRSSSWTAFLALASAIVVLEYTNAFSAAPQPTRITITSGQNPVLSSETVTFTATVEGISPNSGVPTGEIEFFAGSRSMGKVALINSNGLAMASVTVQMAAGVYPILARYYGNGKFALSVSMPPLTQQVLGR